MTLAANPSTSLGSHGALPTLRRLLRRRAPARPDGGEAQEPSEALVRALCHDMRSPLASLEALLGALERPAGPAADPAEVLGLARAQTAHLASCLLYTSPSPRDGLLSRMPSSA